nr:ribonuclease H-like domain-containing protein [Tanacetum cinerariifolium]
MSKIHKPDAPIVEDWISDSEDETEIESVPKQREPSFVTFIEHVKSSRESVKKVEHHKQATNLRINNQNSREIDGGYVAFGGNPKGDIECVVLSSDYKLLDENHVLLRVPRENNMYNVDLKNVVPSGGIRPKWIFDIDALTMSMNYQPVIAGNQPNDNGCIKENLDADLKNTDDDVANAAFDVKENENDVHVFAYGRHKTDNKKHNEKAKSDDKGKSPIDSLIGVRDLRAEFEDFFNNTNRVNAISAPINAAGPNLTNSTNSFNTASPFVNVVSLNFRIAGKYSFVDLSKNPDDPDMPELEDIVYSDDEEYVGVEADLSNLETNIHVCPIPITRVYKDHHVNQIIDLPKGKRAIGSKWVFRNKKDEREITIRDKARLVTQGHTKEEGTDYDEVLVLIARIEAIQLFLAYAFFMGFMDKFQMSSIGELTFFLGLQVKQKDDGIFISQDKYVAEILRKFGFTDVKSASTPIETEKPLLKDPDGEDVDVHIYSAKRTAWNEFSCSMASAVICLATGRKFSFAKYIFDSMARNVNSPKWIPLLILFYVLGRMHPNKGEITTIDADEGITLVDVETDEEVVAMDAESKERLNQDFVNAASKGVSVVSAPKLVSDAEPTIKYQNLKKKPVSIAQAKKNMMIYLKNMAGYKMEFFKWMTYDKECFKKLRAAKVLGFESTQETPSNDPKEMTKEDVQNMLEIVLVTEFKVEALQVKYPIIDWEIHTEEDLVALCNFVKEKISSAEPSKDKEKALWVELKRLFEPDADDVLWNLQRYIHAPLL